MATTTRRAKISAPAAPSTSPDAAEERTEKLLLQHCRDLTFVHVLACALFTVEAAMHLLLEDIIGRNVALHSAWRGLLHAGATELVIEISMSKLIAVYFVISAFANIVVLLPGVWPMYVRAIARSHNPFRTIEYIVSASVMIIVLAIVGGERDLVMMMVLAGLSTLTQVLGHFAERYRSLALHVSAWVPFAVVWGRIWHTHLYANAASQFGSSSLSTVTLTWTFLLFCTFGVLQSFEMIVGVERYAAVEYSNIVLSLVTKSSLGLLTILSIQESFEY